ncbi:MAG: hypothetical protein AB8G99_00205 [Planctomycetaceae bacterium]
MNLSIFAQSSAPLSLLDQILDPSVLVFLIPISAILGGCAVAITKTIVRHRERITMIQNGFDPDAYATHA